MQQRVNDNCICGTDKHDAKNLENESNCASGAKSGSILNHKEKAVPGRFAEVLGRQSNLNIGILSQKLDESFEAIEAAAGGA